MAQRRVADDITDALFELLKTKKFKEITTTEIINKAGVCRASFYRNFYLPEDIIQRYSNSMFDVLHQITPISRENMHEHICTVNHYFLTQRERLSLIEKQGLFYLIEDALLEHCLYQTHCLGVFTNQYQVEFYAGASARQFRTWLHNGFKETPEEMASIVESLIQWDLLKG